MQPTNVTHTEVGCAGPDHTTDCHVHVFDPACFAYAAERRYTPPPATVDALLDLHRRLGIRRVVLVQPSVYGTDNRCLLAALDRLGEHARGVAVIGDDATAAQLASMHRRGVRGVRLNLHVAREVHIESARARIERLSESLGDLPWLVQIHAALPVIVALADTLRALRQPVLIDHFGLAKAGAGIEQAGFRELLALAAAPNIHIKLSGPYQISMQTPDYADVAPIARALLAAAPDRVVWGSDWPHPGGAQRPVDAKPEDIEPFRNEDDGRNLSLVSQWCPDADARRRLLVENPARLFGFEAATAAPDVS